MKQNTPVHRARGNKLGGEKIPRKTAMNRRLYPNGPRGNRTYTTKTVLVILKTKKTPKQKKRVAQNAHHF